MRRSELTASNQVAHELSLLKRYLADFTGRQPVSGASGILSYEARTASTWDFTATIGLDSDSTGNIVHTTDVTVDFTGNGSQQYPIENIFASLYVNGTTLADQPTLRVSGFYTWDDASSRRVTLLKWGVSEPIYWSDLTRYRWTFRFESFKQVTVYFKAFAGGSSPGTLSVSGVTT